MKKPGMGSLQVAILVAASSCLLFAQPAPVPQPRSILINVLDRDGNAVGDLERANFRVRVNGKAAQVLEVCYSVAPRRIVVLLDVSGSMRGVSERNKTWQIARDALRELLDQTPHDVPLALLTFSNQVHDVFDFSQGRPSIAAWLQQDASQRPNIQGHTALRDAILVAVKMLQPVRPGDSMYVITDGDDTDSHVSSSETKRALQESGVRLFAFLLATSVYPSDEETRGRDEFLGIARESGGFVFGVRGGAARGATGYPAKSFESEYNEAARNEIKSYAQALGGLVNGFYTIRIEVPQLHKDAKITLEIVDKAGAVRKDVEFTHQNSIPGAK
jgi:uncharacterized protein YegL